MFRKYAETAEPCGPVHQCRRQSDKPACESIGENSVLLTPCQIIELTPQGIIVMMGAVIAAFSSFFMLTFWYFGVISIENFRERPPI